MLDSEHPLWKMELVEQSPEPKAVAKTWTRCSAPKTTSTNPPQLLTLTMTSEAQLPKQTSPSQTWSHPHSSRQVARGLMLAHLQIPVVLKFVYSTNQFLDHEHSVRANRRLVIASFLEKLKLQRPEIKQRLLSAR